MLKTRPLTARLRGGCFKETYECYAPSSSAVETPLQLDRAVDVINDTGPGGAGDLLLVVHEALEAELAVGGGE